MAEAESKTCDARKKNGQRCTLSAGWGTPHTGFGPCKFHGGCLPVVERAIARRQAYAFVVGQLGHDPEIDNLAAAALAVRLAKGAVDYWRGELAAFYEDEKAPDVKAVEGFRTATLDLARMSDLATKSGVAERLVAITERMAERIAMAFEDAFAGEKIAREQKARIIKRFGQGLAVLEAAETLDEVETAA